MMKDLCMVYQKKSERYSICFDECLQDLPQVDKFSSEFERFSIMFWSVRITKPRKNLV